MVVRIVKNTTLSPITLGDLSGISVPASGEVDLGASFNASQMSASDDLAIQLGNGNLVLNIGGDDDIPFPRSLDIIRDMPQLFKTTPDDKLVVNATPQPSASTDFNLTSVTDCGYDGTSPDLLHTDHTVFVYGQEEQGIDRPCGLYVDNGQNNELSKYWLNSNYLEFHVLGNRTFFYDGGVMWRGLSDNGNNGMMSLTFSAVSSVFDPTDYEVVPGTGNSVIIDGYLVVPIPGGVGGTHSLPIGQNIENTPWLKISGIAPAVMTGTYYAPAFWQIDYDLTEGRLFNLLPTEDPYATTRSTSTSDPNVTRVYGNFFTTEIPLMTFVKDLLVIGNSSNYFNVSSGDSTELPHGVKLRVDCKTVVVSPHVNTPWTMVGYMKTYREHTV